MAVSEIIVDANGSGGKLITQNYKLIGAVGKDSTSATITVPSNTDFIVVVACNITGNVSVDCTGHNMNLGLLASVGDTVSFSETYYSGNNSFTTNAQTAEWTSATSITQTRANTSSLMIYYFCQYV